MTNVCRQPPKNPNRPAAHPGPPSSDLSCRNGWRIYHFHAECPAGMPNYAGVISVPFRVGVDTYEQFKAAAAAMAGRPVVGILSLSYLGRDSKKN